MMTLAGLTQWWLSRLEPRSIGSFEELNALFIHHFASSKHYHKTTPPSQPLLDEVAWSEHPAGIYPLLQPYYLKGTFSHLGDPSERIFSRANERRFFLVIGEKASDQL